MKKSLQASAAALGSRGGKAGVGESKRRGDSAFYRGLVARRWDRRRAGTGMAHRHLTHQRFTLAAIDDVIGNGQWDSWKRLRMAVREDARIQGKVLRVCSARIHDPFAQRYHFWKLYAEKVSAAS